MIKMLCPVCLERPVYIYNEKRKKKQRILVNVGSCLDLMGTLLGACSGVKGIL